MVVGKANTHASAIRVSIFGFSPDPDPIIAPAMPEVMMCVLLTGGPVKPALAIRPAPTRSAEAPWASVRCARPTRSPRVWTIRLKLDELLRATEGARPALVDLNRLSDEQIKRLEQQLHAWRQQAPGQ